MRLVSVWAMQSLAGLGHHSMLAYRERPASRRVCSAIGRWLLTAATCGRMGFRVTAYDLVADDP